MLGFPSAAPPDGVIFVCINAHCNEILHVIISISLNKVIMYAFLRVYAIFVCN